MNISLLIAGGLALVFALGLAAVGVAQYLTLGRRRLPGAPRSVEWNWFQGTNPTYYPPEARGELKSMRRLAALQLLVTVVAVVLLVLALT
jgi:hypothetical protein